MIKVAHTSELTDHLGFWLRLVSNHVSQAFARRLAEHDVTVAEWVMLRSLLGKAAIAPSLLARQMGMTAGAISKLADRLIAKRLVQRTASAADRRAQTLALTRSGEAMVPVLAALADANDAACFAHLTDSERATLEKLLRRTADRSGIAMLPVD